MILSFWFNRKKHLDIDMGIRNQPFVLPYLLLKNNTSQHVSLVIFFDELISNNDFLYVTILKQCVLSTILFERIKLKKEVNMMQISKTEDFNQEFSSTKEYDDK